MDPDVKKQLLMFDQFSAALKSEQSGNFKGCFSNLDEIETVLKSYLSPDAPLLRVLQFQRANAQRYSGLLDAACATALSLNNKSPEERVSASQFATMCTLLSGNAGKAMTYAEQAIKLCESQSSENVDVLSSCYSFAGTYLLFFISHAYKKKMLYPNNI